MNTEFGHFAISEKKNRKCAQICNAGLNKLNQFAFRKNKTTTIIPYKQYFTGNGKS